MDSLGRAFIGGALLVATVTGAILFSRQAEPKSSRTERVSEERATRAVARKLAADTDTAKQPAAEQPSEERKLMLELSRLQTSDKARALSLLNEAETKFASGVFVEARNALRVTLLVDLGRMKEARERTREFLARFPTSEYRPLVQGVTGIHPRPGAAPGKSSGAQRP